MGSCGGNCPSYASLFNPSWVYNNGIGVGNPYFNNLYQCNNFYPSIYALNYNTPIYFSGNYSIWNYSASNYPSTNYSAVNTFQYVYPQQTYVNLVENKTTTTGNKPVSNSVIPTYNDVKKDSVKALTSKIDLGNEFVSTANKYKSCSEKNGSHRKFCVNSTCKSEDPFDQEWCTDFVTYVVKEAYEKQGKTVPAGFGHHDVSTLKNWAISNNCFIRTSNKSQKGTYIANNIKPGDIMIINENGASHTGFVKEIDKSSGVIKTIEGNRDDMVKEYSYSPNYPYLSGFIRLAS